MTESNSRTTKHYFGYIAEKTGIKTVNLGVSGTGYMRRKDINRAFYQRVSDIPEDADVITIFGNGNDLSSDQSWEMSRIRAPTRSVVASTQLLTPSKNASL